VGIYEKKFATYYLTDTRWKRIPH